MAETLRRKIKRLAIVSPVLVGLGIALWVVAKKQFVEINTNSTLYPLGYDFMVAPVTTETPTPLFTGESTSLINVPPLYPNLPWSKETSSEPDMPQPYLIYNGKTVELRHGQLWTAERREINTADLVARGELDDGVFNYYRGVMSKMGWVENRTLNGKKL